jgi:hypothetical protein
LAQRTALLAAWAFSLFVAARFQIFIFHDPLDPLDLLIC